MMTQQLEVSILAAPLAAIDRRALSQAWYSALHLARSDRSLVPSRECGRCAVAVPIEATRETRYPSRLSPRADGTRAAHSEQTQGVEDNGAAERSLEYRRIATSCR